MWQKQICVQLSSHGVIHAPISCTSNTGVCQNYHYKGKEGQKNTSKSSRMIPRLKGFRSTNYNTPIIYLCDEVQWNFFVFHKDLQLPDGSGTVFHVHHHLPLVVVSDVVRDVQHSVALVHSVVFR